MKNDRRFMLSKWVLVMTALLLAGCGRTQPVQFYTLSSLNGMQSPSSDLSVGEEVAIGVGPVEFPELLNKPQIVTRTGSHKLHVDEFHRWGSPLDEDFTSVLAENLSTLLATQRVSVFPWGGYFRPAYQVVMNVQRFDGQPGGYVTLNATWTVLGQDAYELATRRSVIEEQASGGGYESLVSAKSHALSILSREIAEEIHRLESKGTY
ncbi:MAG: membrane integrity-associated transporter subunit PqiC [Deltaproteobacteria bacterium]|nr:membrane integrity-associated transporter subunit PqiC [Deltaproteobacteria bacterium]